MTATEHPPSPVVSDRVAPHTPLTSYYGSESERHGYVVDLFNKSAAHYNSIERIFGNFGLWYRGFSLKRAGMRPGMHVLDVAMGTGAVARNIVKIVGPTGSVTGCDPSPGMIAQARRWFSGPVSRGVADALPFVDDHFDFVTMGIALRHVNDLATTFGEYFRVLKPGGTMWILEGHVPDSKIGMALTRFMWAKVVPGMTYAFTGNRDAKVLMDYYWDTVEFSAPKDTILDTMRRVGFENPTYRMAHPVCAYVGKKPLR